MNRIPLLLCLICAGITFSQLRENFDDGDFTFNPTWKTDTNCFIVNEEKQLQSNSNSSGNISISSFIHFDHEIEQEWRFTLSQSFSGSANNYSKVYILADGENASEIRNGIYLLFGESGSQDQLRIFELIDGINFEIAAGEQGAISTGVNAHYRILRNNVGSWTIQSRDDLDQEFQLEAQGIETGIPTGDQFLWNCQFTASNATKFHIDNIYFGPILSDLYAPVLEQVLITSDTSLDLLFNEHINSIGLNDNSFEIHPGMTIANFQTEENTIHLSFQDQFENGQEYQISIKNISDTMGNDTSVQMMTFQHFSFSTPKYADIIISEILADPSPKVGLPEVEYLEIMNTSSTKFFNLSGWTIYSDNDSCIIDSLILTPNQYILIVDLKHADSFPGAHGLENMIGLKNELSVLGIYSEEGHAIDTLTYSKTWYEDNQKDDGGWSLERINPLNKCSTQDNWGASKAENGGTPAFENSINFPQNDIDAPKIDDIFFTTENKIKIVLSDGVDTNKLQISNVSTDLNLNVKNLQWVKQYGTEFEIEFFQNLPYSTPFTLEIEALQDCHFNQGSSSYLTIYPEQPQASDLIINELLFDPHLGSSDFIELLNKSDKYLTLNQLKITRISESGTIDSSQVSQRLVLEPGEIICLSEDDSSYPVYYSDYDFKNTVITDIPNFPSDAGEVFLTFDKDTIQRIAYHSDWHFKLLQENKGKSLERISSNPNENLRGNYHTAAEPIGFASPGKPNSQTRTTHQKNQFELIESIISPDNDGYQDVLIGQYNFVEAGHVGTIKIYNSSGVLINSIMENHLLSVSGTISWDGLNKNQQKTSIGQYVLIFEVVHPTNGSTFVHKSPFVVAGKI